MQTLLRALIVDSEAPARELLQDMLATHRNVRVVGEANSASTALSLYDDLHPDLVFMDVKMPKGDGFALLPKLQPLPAIIFVTACDEFAVKAFEVDAVDFLLKPVRPERLANALQRVVYSLGVWAAANAERSACIGSDTGRASNAGPASKRLRPAGLRIMLFPGQHSSLTFG
jgi:two-component system, LytTR family, response regulator